MNDGQFTMVANGGSKPEFAERNLEKQPSLPNNRQWQFYVTLDPKILSKLCYPVVHSENVG